MQCVAGRNNFNFASSPSTGDIYQVSMLNTTANSFQNVLSDARAMQDFPSLAVFNAQSAEFEGISGIHDKRRRMSEESLEPNEYQPVRKLSESDDGSSTASDDSLKRFRKQSVPEDHKDEKYWRRRWRNNLSAKKSREAKRSKEQDKEKKIEMLEQENAFLKFMLAGIVTP